MRSTAGLTLKCGSFRAPLPEGRCSRSLGVKESSYISLYPCFGAWVSVIKILGRQKLEKEQTVRSCAHVKGSFPLKIGNPGFGRNVHSKEPSHIKEAPNLRRCLEDAKACTPGFLHFIRLVGVPNTMREAYRPGSQQYAT